MLVLSRKAHEAIVIDDRIVIEVLAVKGNRIRVGIRAPADVRVRRGELEPLAPGAGDKTVPAAKAVA